MKKKKIMVVDDEKDFLNIIKMNLEMTDKYEVVPLSNGKDIVLHVKKSKPDIILLDIIMPDVDGAQACRMLKEDPGCSKIPVIALSVMDTDEDKQMMYKLGVLDFLTKPVDMNDLIARVEETLRKKRKP